MCNEEEKTHLHMAAVFLEGGERQAGRGNNKDVQHASAACHASNHAGQGCILEIALRTCEVISVRAKRLGMEEHYCFTISFVLIRVSTQYCMYRS